MQIRRCVLIADDEEVSRMALAMLLRIEGFDVIEACDGVEAVERARQHLPDVVLMDLAMPIMDGFRATELIKEITDIPVIACTGVTRNDEDWKALFDDVVEKPYSAELIIGQLNAAIDRK